MSKYTDKKSTDHKVKHIFSGKAHIYEVESSSGNIYNTIVQVSCDCEYMAIQGIPNGKMCSHVLATLKEIVNSAEINPERDLKPTNNLKQNRINECLKLVRPGNRKINEIRSSDGESESHRNMKEIICKSLEMQGKSYITEAIFEIGLRADILVLDDFKVIEIANTESDKSLERKQKQYSKLRLQFEVVRC